MKYLQHRNDAFREEERDLEVEDVELIPSDHNSDSESIGTTSKPASSSSKETKEQNATVETNPNKISKEQNEFFLNKFENLLPIIQRFSIT